MKVDLNIIVSASLVFVVIFGYYIIRNGDSILLLPYEYELRKLLTDIFKIRPRFKEFLIGYEIITLYLYYSIYKQKNIFILGVLSVIPLTSVLNTFCHGTASYTSCCIRTLIGLISFSIIFLMTFFIVMINKIIKKKVRYSRQA